jgi:two-component system, cell cycle response regulator
MNDFIKSVVGSFFPATQQQVLQVEEAPAVASNAAAAIEVPTPALQLLARGFVGMERSLIEGTVRMSQRRTPRLELLADDDLDSADLVIIDTRSERAVQWAKSQPALARKTVLWVDGPNVGPGHTLIRRPVQWSNLPIILARALEQRQTPAQAPRQNSEPPVRASSPAVADSRPVLVVDDSLAVRAYLRSLLEARGISVVESENGQAAIQAVSQTAYSCVLMDVLMPGIDGYDACKQIKARLRGAANVPVIMLTSKSSPFDRIRGKMAGCDAYLTKPVDADQLHAVMAQHLSRQAERSQPRVTPTDRGAEAPAMQSPAAQRRS